MNLGLEKQSSLDFGLDILIKWKNFRFNMAYYFKFGFGSVFLENSTSNLQHFDKSMLIIPHIEPIFRITSFFKIGLGIFYEIHSGVNLVSLKNQDYNALGMNVSFRFTSSHN